MDWNSSSTSNMQSDGRIFAGKMCPLIVQGIDHSVVKLLLILIPLSMANPDYPYYSINLSIRSNKNNAARNTGYFCLAQWYPSG